MMINELYLNKTNKPHIMTASPPNGETGVML